MPMTVKNGNKTNIAAHGSVYLQQKSPTGNAGYIVTDNRDGTFTIYGQNTAGDQTNIAESCVLTLTSSDATVIGVEKTFPMTFKAIPLKVGSANVSATIVWNGAINPTNVITIPFTVAGDPRTQLKETMGASVLAS